MSLFRVIQFFHSLDAVMNTGLISQIKCCMIEIYIHETLKNNKSNSCLQIFN